jgi:hypothetical protein
MKRAILAVELLAVIFGTVVWAGCVSGPEQKQQPEKKNLVERLEEEYPEYIIVIADDHTGAIDLMPNGTFKYYTWDTASSSWTQLVNGGGEYQLDMGRNIAIITKAERESIFSERNLINLFDESIWPSSPSRLPALKAAYAQHEQEAAKAIAEQKAREAEQQAKAIAEKKAKEAEQQAKEAAERQRQEEERIAASKINREQLLKKIKLAGVYINSGKGTWHAFKFIDGKDSIEVFVVYNNGRNEEASLYGCSINDSTLTVARSSLTILDNGNLQTTFENGETTTYVFVPFSGVKGKAYSRIVGRGNLAYAFPDSHYVVQTNNGRIIDEADRTYEYANGEITFKYQGLASGWLTEVGPFLVSGTGEIWQQDR